MPVSDAWGWGSTRESSPNDGNNGVKRGNAVYATLNVTNMIIYHGDCGKIFSP